MISQLRTFEILEKGRVDDRQSLYCDLFLSILIFVNLIAVCLETIDSLYTAYKPIFVAVELVSVSIFSIEYGLRIWSRPAAPNQHGKTAMGKRLSYIFSFTGIIDLLAILPSILPLLLGGIDLRWLRILRLMRLLKFSHYSSALEDLFSAVRHEWRSFVATLYLLILAIFISSSLIYVFEQNVQPEHFGSIPDAMWWSLITLTTVGYGDVSPLTPIGKIIGSFTAIIGVLTVALMTGIVSSSFANRMALKKTMLDKEIEESLEDGVISAEELGKIKSLAAGLNMNDDQIEALIKYERMKRSHR